MVLAIGTAQSAGAYTTTGCKYSSPNQSVGVTGLPSGYVGNASSAVDLWSSQTDLNLTKVSLRTPNAQVGNWGASGFAGQANWTCAWGVTSGCNAQLNTYYTDSYVSNKKRTIWLHEFGHCFGLDHETINTAVMFHCAGCAYDNGQTGLHNDDKNGMNALY